MNSDLIVMTFDDGAMAQTVYGSLQAMRKSPVLGLEDSVIIIKNGAGQVQLHSGSQAGPGLAGLLADQIFRSPERAVPAVARAKMDHEFVRAVVSALRNHGSAILFFVGWDSLSDTRELLSALALFRGMIHQTTLSPQSEALWQGML